MRLQFYVLLSRFNFETENWDEVKIGPYRSLWFDGTLADIVTWERNAQGQTCWYHNEIAYTRMDLTVELAEE